MSIKYANRARVSTAPTDHPTTCGYDTDQRQIAFGDASVSLNDPATRRRYERLVTHLYGLGVRSVGEFIEQVVGKSPLSVADTLAQLERYGRLTSEMMHVTGGSSFPCPPIHEVTP